MEPGPGQTGFSFSALEDDDILASVATADAAPAPANGKTPSAPATPPGDPYRPVSGVATLESFDIGFEADDEGSSFIPGFSSAAEADAAPAVPAAPSEADAIVARFLEVYKEKLAAEDSAAGDAPLPAAEMDSVELVLPPDEPTDTHTRFLPEDFTGSDTVLTGVYNQPMERPEPLDSLPDDSGAGEPSRRASRFSLRETRLESLNPPGGGTYGASPAKSGFFPSVMAWVRRLRFWRAGPAESGFWTRFRTMFRKPRPVAPEIPPAAGESGVTAPGAEDGNGDAGVSPEAEMDAVIAEAMATVPETAETAETAESIAGETATDMDDTPPATPDAEVPGDTSAAGERHPTEKTLLLPDDDAPAPAGEEDILADMGDDLPTVREERIGSTGAAPAVKDDAAEDEDVWGGEDGGDDFWNNSPLDDLGALDGPAADASAPAGPEAPAAREEGYTTTKGAVLEDHSDSWRTISGEEMPEGKSDGWRTITGADLEGHGDTDGWRTVSGDGTIGRNSDGWRTITGDLDSDGGDKKEPASNAAADDALSGAVADTSAAGDLGLPGEWGDLPEDIMGEIADDLPAAGTDGADDTDGAADVPADAADALAAETPETAAPAAEVMPAAASAGGGTAEERGGGGGAPRGRGKAPGNTTALAGVGGADAAGGWDDLPVGVSWSDEDGGEGEAAPEVAEENVQSLDSMELPAFLTRTWFGWHGIVEKFRQGIKNLRERFHHHPEEEEKPDENAPLPQPDAVDENAVIGAAPASAAPAAGKAAKKSAATDYTWEPPKVSVDLNDIDDILPTSDAPAAGDGDWPDTGTSPAAAPFGGGDMPTIDGSISFGGLGGVLDSGDAPDAADAPEDAPAPVHTRALAAIAGRARRIYAAADAVVHFRKNWWLLLDAFSALLMAASGAAIAAYFLYYR